MATSLPPDLRVLCRKLTSIPPPQLPHALPSLINHILNCKEPLSVPQEQKPKDKSSEAAQLVHKLKASITTLLNGRTREARFAAIGLIKAVVDVAGWEVLHGSEPWVRGLLSIVQKSDPFTSKELAAVTLARIYLLVHPYQTLVREIATPTLPAFVTACVALLKSSTPGEPPKTPLSVVETLCDIFSALVPLYPTIFRPFSSQIKTAVRLYLAPTLSDSFFVPNSLRGAARRLVISLHHVAAKSGGSDEWAKLIDGILKDLHATADQVLRAVNETWDGSNGYSRSAVGVDGEPHGGGTSVGELPSWTGINAGADRLIGLFQYLETCLRCSTKTAVTIPTGAILDAVSRVCVIARLSPKSQTWDQALQTNAAVGRDEKEELWSLIPGIHIASFQLVEALSQRLGQSTVALTPEILDHLVRGFKSGISIPAVRLAGYSVFKEVFVLTGPSLPKPSVDMLDPLIGACCRDLQQDAGHIQGDDKPSTATTDPKKNSVAANADLFLKPQASLVVEKPTLEQRHKEAAAALLTTVFSYIPQRHLRPSLRGLLDQTAILTNNRDAMLASVLNPYKDQRGRVYPSILPHLSQQFPDDLGLEIVRTNLRASNQSLAEAEPLEELPIEQEDEEEDADEEMADGGENQPVLTSGKTDDVFAPGTLATAPQTQKALPIQSNPFEPSASHAGDSSARASSPPKRKHESLDSVPHKRQVLEKSPSPAPLAAPVVASATSLPAEDEDDEEDDDDESVHLNMELEDDDDEGEEEE